MRLHILYRLCDKENPTVKRPDWYSKVRCYVSLSRRLRDTPASLANVDTTIILDGAMPSWMENPPRIIALTEGGKDKSMLQCYQEALGYQDEDWVYFVEDDYMHEWDALPKLLHCIEDVKPDLVSLYDHPDRYKDLPEHNLTQGHNDIYVSRDHHWRTIPSTCMTFACSVRVLKDNRELFEEWKHVDFELFPRLLGLKGDRPKHYLMVGAIPSLATHCQEGYLAPMTEWYGKWT